MKIPSVKGFRDVLPEERARWVRLESRARDVFGRYSFREVGVPIVERTDLFRRSIGETTDIVEKEMYTFEDRDGSSLTLRPEGTASVVRAYVEHAVQQQEQETRWFYLGPMFRRERPQKGRLRQFHQIGAELMGRDDPLVDAEVLLLLHDLLEAFGLASRSELRVNTLGCRACRPAFRDELVRWGRERFAELCEDCRRRIDQNPLRLLDCKQPGCVALREGAPRMLEQACEGCREHFERVRALVRAEDVPLTLDPYMVRGLDYYCRTAFEVVAQGLGAQNAVGGGGRYDGLVKQLGGGDVPGIGFALGVERLAMLLEEPTAGERGGCALLPLGAAAEEATVRMAHRLRRAGLPVVVTNARKSLKSQMRQADRLGAQWAVLIGETELAAGSATVRDMRAKQDHPGSLSLAGSGDEIRMALEGLRGRISA